MNININPIDLLCDPPHFKPHAGKKNDITISLNHVSFHTLLLQLRLLEQILSSMILFYYMQDENYRTKNH